jgi:hypothetical protein
LRDFHPFVVGELAAGKQVLGVFGNAEPVAAVMAAVK